MPPPSPTTLTNEELLLAVATTLHANGEATVGTLAAVEPLAAQLGQPAQLLLSWEEVRLRHPDGRERAAPAMPATVNMRRVVATLRAAEAIGAGQLTGPAATAALAAARQLPDTSLGWFTLACTAGAGALALLNGATHWRALTLIMGCAAAGALLRRGLARWLGANVLAQLFAAALLAGLVGGLGVRWQLSSALRLVALGPLLVLVPGPALLNGALDLAALRLPLGLARVGEGLLSLLAISLGVLLGLSIGGAGVLPVAAGPPVPLWLDLLAAGVAAACYGAFFTLPARLLGYPVLVGMLAHAVRWASLNVLGFSNAAAAGLACLVAGSILVPVARRHRLPFAGVGFAAVVALVPGIFVFRLSGGLLAVQHLGPATSPALLAAIVADATTALTTVLAMLLGLSLPKIIVHRLLD